MESVPLWHLWSQPLLLLVICGLTWRVRGELTDASLSRPLQALCLLAPLVVGLLLPQSSYHFAGHEGSYGSALLGVSPAVDDLQSYGTMPVPMGLSWMLGKVAPGLHQQQLWLIANRASMGAVLWLMALLVLSLARSHGRDSGSVGTRAAWLVVLLALASVPLAGWSATGYFLVPALAAGACALLLAMRGQGSLAVLWAVLALGSRMELGLFLLVVLAVVPMAGWRRDLKVSGRIHLALAVPALALEVFFLATKKARLPVDSFTLDASILWENLLNIPLGGVLFQPLMLLFGVVIVGAAGLGLRNQRSLSVLAAAYVLALVQPMLLIDVGARHFLPAMVLGLPLLALALARLLTIPWRSRPAAIAIVALLIALIAVPACRGYADLQHRYVAGHDSHLDHWLLRADKGVRGSIDEVLEPSGCYVVMPGGENVWKGASEGGDVREVHNSLLALREGQCVRWVFANEVEFSGSASAERVDRAIHTLGLEPLGWLDPPPFGERPWILFGVGQGDQDL